MDKWNLFNEKEKNLLQIIISEHIELILDEFCSEGSEEIVENGLYEDIKTLMLWMKELNMVIENWVQEEVKRLDEAVEIETGKKKYGYRKLGTRRGKHGK